MLKKQFVLVDLHKVMNAKTHMCILGQTEVNKETAQHQWYGSPLTYQEYSSPFTCQELIQFLILQAGVWEKTY